MKKKGDANILFKFFEKEKKKREKGAIVRLIEKKQIKDWKTERENRSERRETDRERERKKISKKKQINK